MRDQCIKDQVNFVMDLVRMQDQIYLERIAFQMKTILFSMIQLLGDAQFVKLITKCAEKK